MKKIIKFLFIWILLFLFIPSVQAKADDEITIYFFHGDGCPHCAEEKTLLEKIKDEPNVVIEQYEVWYDENNQQLMEKVKKAFEINRNGVPLTVIGNTYFLGYRESLGDTIERCIEFYRNNDYVDQVSLIKKGKDNLNIVDAFSKEEAKSDQDLTVDIPIKGKLNLKDISISSAAVVIGLIDGFNPCAMWVLLFLISVLIGMKDRKRMWILGLTFLLTSAAVYMIIMFSWLNIIVNIGTSIFIQKLIAFVAIIGGLVNLRSYLKSSDSGGCQVVDNQKRKSIFKKIRQFTNEKSFFIAIIGVMTLAVSVNLVELACSAGLPVVFTQLLAINHISGWEGFLYTLLYIFFFLIDDLIVFFIAMFTMNATGISTKYNKYSHLIGGILMLIIGILLLVKPELLMFNF